MAFVWSEDVGVGASIDAADVNEIKTNLDSIYYDLGIDRNGCSGAGWSELPVSAGGPITSAHPQELRDVTDYADDNKCLSDNSTDYSTVYSDEDSVYQSSYDSGYNSTYNSGVDSGDRTGVYTGEDSGYDSFYDSGYQSSYDSGYDGSYDGVVNTGYRTGVYTTEDAGYYATFYNGVLSDYDSTVYSYHFNTDQGANYFIA